MNCTPDTELVVHANCTADTILVVHELYTGSLELVFNPNIKFFLQLCTEVLSPTTLIYLGVKTAERNG